MVKFGFIALGTILIASAAVSGATLKHIMTSNDDDQLITGSVSGADRSGYYIDVYKLNHALNKD